MTEQGTQQKTATQSRWKGVVVSVAGDKTAIVEVTRYETHSKYHKKFRTSKRYAVHDPENACVVGNTVEFVACKPISKKKRFIVAA